MPASFLSGKSEPPACPLGTCEAGRLCQFLVRVSGPQWRPFCGHVAWQVTGWISQLVTEPLGMPASFPGGKARRPMRHFGGVEMVIFGSVMAGVWGNAIEYDFGRS
jgi:hypothetical protein